MAVARRDIGQILVTKGLLSQEDYRTALEVQKQTTQSLERTLVDMEFVDEKTLMEAKAELLKVDYVSLRSVRPDATLVRKFRQEMLKQHKAIPLAQDGRTLMVAMADPADIMAIDNFRMMGAEVKPMLALEDEIEQAINEAFDTDDEIKPAAGGMNPFLEGGRSVAEEALTEMESIYDGRFDSEIVEQEVGRVEDLVDQAPIIRIVNSIFQRALQDGASDIHIEPQRRNCRVRYRIDGILHEMMTVPKYVHPPMISRVKIMADLDIAERRVAQDGSIRLRHGNKDYDLRVSIIPSINGEKCVMRILDKTNVMIGLNKLGMFPDTQAQVERLIVQPNGIILSTGPTGSGKTTTQYSILNKINSIEVNITTIEDPVEYELPGITQVAVNRKAGVVFSNALRSFVRQDPDIILVGEIRDLETAETAIQASLTGHLVLSTVHTNDAPSTITRLVDMGVEPFLIAASLIGALAQRLARKICDNCKVPYNPPMEALERFGFQADSSKPITFYKGEGCEVCRHTGYKGRTGLFELMMINAEIAELIVKRASLQELREACLANGMVTLQQDGLRKVLEGVTTIEEVMRVVISVGQTVE